MPAIPPGWSLRDARRHLAKENAKMPAYCVKVPRDKWPSFAQGNPVIGVWRSRTVTVQIWQEADGVVRLSINRSEIDGKLNWLDGLTWDDLQRIKSECGFGDRFAVEVYPADEDVVNVANIRHLFVLPERPAFAWHK